MYLFFYIVMSNSNNINNELHRNWYISTSQLLLVMDFTAILWVYGGEKIFLSVFKNNFKGVNLSLNSGCDKW